MAAWPRLPGEGTATRRCDGRPHPEQGRASGGKGPEPGRCRTHRSLGVGGSLRPPRRSGGGKASCIYDNLRSGWSRARPSGQRGVPAATSTPRWWPRPRPAVRPPLPRWPRLRSLPRPCRRSAPGRRAPTVSTERQGVGPGLGGRSRSGPALSAHPARCLSASRPCGRSPPARPCLEADARTFPSCRPGSPFLSSRQGPYPFPAAARFAGFCDHSCLACRRAGRILQEVSCRRRSGPKGRASHPAPAAANVSLPATRGAERPAGLLAAQG